MIDFFCSNCGLKFKVKTVFAGRSSRCPTCKQALVVPGKAPTLSVPLGEIPGTSSSLYEAGVREGVSLEQKTLPLVGQKSVRELLTRRTKNNERYIIEGEIARGGMGAVLRAVDCDIRREVAIKYLLDQSDPKRKLRFVEEAQITGQLEHPNIPPIHELGIDGQKKLFFSMKMVRGKSLAQLLDEWRKDPRKADMSLGRLLNIFVNVCNALSYAHSLGVIHRDLKPANIMVGDFGEVYVMDWGLAKVLSGVPASGDATVPESTGLNLNSRVSKVVTSREPEADLTQDGAVVGTPVYMPPEQARGKVNELDERCDVYSLGAILYEMLALEPPVDRNGGYAAVLLRVVDEEIVPPEKRNPRRAKAGQIPRELSAVALKALNKQPADRYPSVKALRRDIERFQEGRSVSAKRDSMRELAWKLVKRNVAVSLVSVIALLLLGVSWGRSTYLDYQEQRLRREKFVPVFVEAAHTAVGKQQFDQALVQISMAVEYDPHHPEARLLKGQLHIVKGDFGKARRELENYRSLVPGDEDAAKLLDICRSGKPGDATTAVELSDVLRKQKAVILAASMVQSRDKLAAIYKQTIDAAWPGLSANLKMEKDGTCAFQVPHPALDPKRLIRGRITSLTPLRGIPLSELDLTGCDLIDDLSPLQGMPLQSLNLTECSKIADLAPLAGMPLHTLRLINCRLVKDLTPLSGMPLVQLDVSGMPLINDLAPLQGAPIEVLLISRCGQLKDLMPLADMPLRSLQMVNCAQVRNLQPLRGLKLSFLNLSNNSHLGDAQLAALQGLPLRNLNLMHTAVRDLGALKGMPLANLDLTGCQVSDLNKLRGLPLEALSLAHCTRVSDVLPLRGMPLTTLSLTGCKGFRDLPALRGLKIKYLYLLGSGAVDVRALPELPLEELVFDPKTTTLGLAELRQHPTLKMISATGSERRAFYPAKEFWTRYDAGEFK